MLGLWQTLNLSRSQMAEELGLSISTIQLLELEIISSDQLNQSDCLLLWRVFSFKASPIVVLKNVSITVTV
jgi:hypothetical protein